MKEIDLIQDLCIPDEKRAMDIFRGIRWVNGVHCPKCDSLSIQNRGMQGKSKRYSCNNCGSNFSDLTGTIFANKNIPMGEMFYILNNLDKKSIKRLSEELNHKWETINLLAKEFKENLTEKAKDLVLSNEVEIDEMYHSAGNKGIKKRTKNTRAETTRKRNI